MPGEQCRSPLSRCLAAAYLLLCLMLATPAQAQPCNRYDAAMTATELTEIRNQVQSHLPARYHDAIGSLEFKTIKIDDEDSLFPRAIPSLNRIEMPSDYYRDHCLMVSFTLRLLRVPKDRTLDALLELLERHGNCLRRGTFNACFRQSLQTEIAQLEPEPAGGDTSADQVRDAFFLVIAHEIAHVLIRRSYPDGLSASLDHPELAADALALQAAILAGRDHRRASLTLFPASFFDGRGVQFDDRRTDLILINRADSSCRSALAFAAGERWGPAIGATFRWAMAPATEAKGQGQVSLTAEADRALGALTETGPGGLDFATICRLPTTQIEAQGRDFRSLLVEIDRVNRIPANRDIAFRALVRFKPQSDAALSFLHTMIVYRLTNEIMWAYDRNDTVAEKQLFETLRQIAAQIDRGSISSLSRGMLGMFVGLNTKRFAPPGSSLDEVISATEPELLEAERYLIDVPASLKIEIARLRLLQADCAGASRRLAVLRYSSDLDIAAEAKRLSHPEGISRSSCEAIAARMRSELRTRRGWK